MAHRIPEYPVNQLFLDRISVRAFTGDLMTTDQVMSLFEAARWAPSSYNNQPWRFVYAVRGTNEWDVLFDLLVPFNKEWSKNGAVLIVFISENLFAFNKKPSRTHSFDTGAAWQNLALQATVMGYSAHGIEGFDYDKAREVLNVPETCTIEAMCCVGKPGPVTILSQEMQAKEVVTQRNPLASMVFHGTFKKTE